MIKQSRVGGSRSDCLHNLMTCPNFWTVCRLIATVALLFLVRIQVPFVVWSTFVLFTFAAFTDYADGELARANNRRRVTPFGTCFDPIADKELTALTLLPLVVDGRAPFYLVAFIIARELLVSGLREYYAKQAVELPVTKTAKRKTAIQFIAISLLILLPVMPEGWHVDVIGFFMLVVAVGITVWTGGEYVVMAYRLDLFKALFAKPR